MPRSPRRPDFTGRIGGMENDVRARKVRPIPHTETKTFIVNGTIATSIYIPPCRVSVIQAPEWKRLIRFDAILESGSAVLDWYLDGDLLLAGVEVDDTGSGSTGVLPTPVDIPFGGGWLRVVIDDATDASHLAAAYTAETSR